MDESMSAAANASRRPSRRRVAASLAAWSTAPFLGGQPRCEPLDRPPVFRTASHQFTIVVPPKVLPPVPLSDVKGQPARLAAVQGKVLLINVWATWCEACRTELPLLDRFYKASAGSVRVAAVSTDQTSRDSVKDYLAKLEIRSLPVYLDPEGRLASSSRESAAPLSLFGMPMTFLITPSGRIAGYIAGAADWLGDDARRLLAYYAAEQR
jgi:thiol-disulfide isomerase/thioredoxin